MVNTREDADFRRRIQRVESLIGEVEQLADPAARSHTKEILQALLDMQGAGLERILEHIAEAGETGFAIIDALASDDLVGSLLLLHGLHPLDIETRVRQALDKVRPYLRSHGGNVELLSVTDGLVRMRMQGSCNGCPSSAMTLKLAIEEAIYEKAPDVAAIEVEGVVEAPAGTSSTFVSVDQLLDGNGNGRAIVGGWDDVEHAASVLEKSVQIKEVSGRQILICRVDGTLYAYQSSCPGCGLKLDEARLEGTALVCAGCAQQYDIPHAGRGLNDSQLHLEPIPLLVEQGRAKVAMPLYKVELA
jgi:Fe-S cluster biogenesis protein NfuA/nitrite reductase/ring-hydroxylating ferredoxin subunit